MKNIISYLLIVFLLFIIGYNIYYQLRDHYSKDDPLIVELKRDMEKIHPEAKNMELYIGDKSYTINKKKIYLCVKDKKNGKVYNKNVLMYVLLHEYAHKICKEEIGHTEKFYQVFDELLKRAEKLGFYNPNMPIPEDYCEI